MVARRGSTAICLSVSTRLRRWRGVGVSFMSPRSKAAVVTSPALTRQANAGLMPAHI